MNAIPNPNLSETDENGFILLPCFHELTAFPLESLYNKMFRIHMKTELDKVKNCQIRFPTGVRLRYRFQFKDANTHVFFAYGNSAQRMVAFSRKISTADRPGTHSDVWKGVLRVPCRFSLLVFSPSVAGEVFEFHILDGHEHLDKCSVLDQNN
uniref:Uncharacterized protein n=1 Tax=Globodera rostochiensis TaxID=31243 RepID=A0A914HYJ4_GLORO